MRPKNLNNRERDRPKRPRFFAVHEPTAHPPHSLGQYELGGFAMKHELNIWVVGGDLRQAKLAQLLAEDGHTVHTYLNTL